MLDGGTNVVMLLFALARYVVMEIPQVADSLHLNATRVTGLTPRGIFEGRAKKDSHVKQLLYCDTAPLIQMPPQAVSSSPEVKRLKSMME